ncbi:exosome complex component 10-like [Babylonia areolata]|uniref:exosome complex component 10-like n=1 Tax=Babylonia areolata TaxID=304850 RepID=UPI003FD61510
MASSGAHDCDASTSKMDVDTNNSEEKPAELFPGCTSINDFSQKMLRTVVQATKASNDLPTGDDYDYYSTYDNVRNIMDLEARRLLQLLQSVMRHHNVKGTISGTSHALELDEQFDVIMDANDQILERVGTAVDEATGVKKNEQKLVVSAINRPNPAVASWNKKRTSSGGSVPVQLLTAKNIQRPQLSFRDKIDNSNKPFVPVIRHKPHAKKSLQESLQLPAGVTLEDTENPEFVYPHPYQFELDEWQPSPEQLEKVVPQEPKPVDTTPPEFIDTASDLGDLCDLLSKEKEIAVDLEHHSYRTFQGFVCLMQISTRCQDFLLDTLTLRSHIGLLNQVFTNPAITKVFHGADSDVEWLQRDFGVYLVNLFDTGQAARVLNCARFSLAHLLQVYCQVEADKQYQLSDWRMRPLHEKMIRYAQEDTHYLLYIYDRMRNELIDRGNEQRNLLQSVYQRSKNVCLKVFRKPRHTADSHHDLYMKSKKVFNSQQLQALKDIYAWRDRTAREEDESTQYVLPNHMLLQMAEILPRERQGVLACCNPIPPLVRQCQHELHSLILQARETTLTQMEAKKTPLEPSSAQHPHYHHTSVTACPHDLSKHGAHLPPPDTGGVPEKPSSSLSGEETDIPLKKRPVLSALDSFNSLNNVGKKNSVASRIQNAFISPFLCFLPNGDGSHQESILKPKTEAKVWRLKQHTAPASQKRKSDVDLNTFAPEFAPPVKKHVQANTFKSTTAAAAAATVLTPSQPSASSAATTPMTSSSLTPADTKSTAEAGKKKKKKKKKPVEPAEEEMPLSSNQMLKKKRKEKKAKKRAFITDSPIGSPPDSPSPVPPTPQSPKGEEKTTQSVPATTTTTPQKMDEDDKKKKKKKKKKQQQILSVSFAAEPKKIAGDADEGGVEEGKKKKKKKQKKKKTLTETAVEEVEENITPFDYSAADKSAVTGKKKTKIHADVYSPHFRGGQKKKHNKGKKERFGAKQKKSITFTSETGGGGKKK